MQDAHHHHHLWHLLEYLHDLHSETFQSDLSLVTVFVFLVQKIEHTQLVFPSPPAAFANFSLF
jgi:hypothetical protein